MAKTTRSPRRFFFTIPLVKHKSAYIEIPERVSLAIGRWGPVPIATLCKTVEIQAGLVP